MSCNTNGKNRQTAADRAANEARLREEARIAAVVQSVNDSASDLEERRPEILAEFPDNSEVDLLSGARPHNIACLRAHIGALLILQEDLPTFMDLAGSMYGSDPSSMDKIGYSHRYSKRHLLGMYGHASIISEGRIPLAISEPIASRLDAIIASQVDDAITQLDYLSNTYPLIRIKGNNALKVGLRIGFFNEKFPTLDYPFTGQTCWSHGLQQRDVRRLHPYPFSKAIASDTYNRLSSFRLNNNLAMDILYP